MSAAGSGVGATVTLFDDASLTTLVQGAGAGDAQGMFDLGVALYHGLGCPPDVPGALQWWRRGAEAGHVRCKLRLVDALCGGEGGRQGTAGEIASLCGSVATSMTGEAAGAAVNILSVPPLLVPASSNHGKQRQAAELDAARRIANTPDAQLTALFLEACTTEALTMLRVLLGLTGERAVDVHADNEAAFREACCGGHLEVVRELLGLMGDCTVDVHEYDEYAFRWACKNGHLEVVRELLGLTGDRAVNVHADSQFALRWACKNGHLEVVHELLGLTGGRSVDVHAGNDDAFRAACMSGHLGVVRELLSLTGEQAVNVHAREDHAFRGACGNGHVNVVRQLLELSADRAVDVHAADDAAFHGACHEGHLGVVRVLLGLMGNRIICPLYKLPAPALQMLSDGLGDPRSPTVAAAWRTISSPGGMLRNAQAHGTTREAAGAGYRVYNWGRRGGLVVWRAVAVRQRREGGASGSTEPQACQHKHGGAPAY